MAVPIYSQNYSVSVKVSTLGISLEGLRSFGEQINARIGMTYFLINIDGGGGTEDYLYNGNLKLLTLFTLMDWYLFKSNFRITSGLFFNLNEGDLILRPNGSHILGGIIYTPEMLGEISTKVKVNLLTPYLGFGLGNRSISEGFDFTMDVGVIYQGTPKVNLSAKGLLAPSAEQESLVEHNTKWFKFYPIISFGIIYNF
jgi:hypothetical protein